MDQRLRERLDQLEEHIRTLFKVEKEFLFLDGSKKSLLAEITRKSQGKSHAEREGEAYASEDWKNFAAGLSAKEAEWNREKRRYELLMKAFDAEYTTLKIEGNVINRQGR